MMESISTEQFLKDKGVFLDVRSPSEYAQGHIPGAFNLPLFSDDERALIGTLYKSQGKAAAVETGLSIVGPKLKGLVASAKSLLQGAPAKVYCWRGGMRSSSLGWLLNLAGIKTFTLQNGYKNFRRWALLKFTEPYCISLLGGLTGSGKTDILIALRNQGEPILDLEALACHRGSSYGQLGCQKPPTNEQFENKIALALQDKNPHQTLWVEDESRMIGQCKIPDGLYSQMHKGPLYFIERDLPFRLNNLFQGYGQFPLSELAASTKRLEKKLGGQRTRAIMANIEQKLLPNAIKMVLEYYDSTYFHSLARRRQKIETLACGDKSSVEVADFLLQRDNQYVYKS